MNTTGNLAQVYQALKTELSVGDIVGNAEANPLAAEIIAGITAEWYVVQTHPAHERIAAAHLVARRFGIYLPEAEQVEISRGRKLKTLRPMFPGYVFVFTWLAPVNYHRIRSCPGIFDFLYLDGLKPAVISESVLNEARAVENRQRPLSSTFEAIGMFKRVKKRWRRSRTISEQAITDNEIVSVRTWSAFRDGLTTLDDHGRNCLLREALGLSSD